MTGYGRPSAHSGVDSGLQAERTALSWTRTSFAVLANGALVLARDVSQHSGALRLVVVAMAVVLAVVTVVIGRRRRRLLARRPLPAELVPRSEVHLIGCGVLVLVIVTVLSLPA